MLSQPVKTAAGRIGILACGTIRETNVRRSSRQPVCESSRKPAGSIAEDASGRREGTEVKRQTLTFSLRWSSAFSTPLGEPGKNRFVLKATVPRRNR